MSVAKIYCWNVQGDLGKFSINTEKIKEKLKKLTAGYDIICLQEVVKKKIVERFARENSYSMIVSNENKKINNHYNVVLSKLPIIDSGEISFTGTNIWKKENVLWVTVKIGIKNLRLYNCHLQIFKVGMSERQQQIRAVYEHAKKYVGSVVVCGDMNTTLPKKGVARIITQLAHRELKKSIINDNKISSEDERYSFAKIAADYDFKDLLPINQASWGVPFIHWEIFKLKLDWFLVRDIVKAEANLGQYYSDHRPILAQVEV